MTQTEEKTHLEQLISYCVSCNPDGIRSILIENDLATYETPFHMEKAAMELVRRDGVEGVVEILSVHPDKEALTEAMSAAAAEDPSADSPIGTPEEEPKKPCGCGGGTHDDHHHNERGSESGQGFIAKYVDGKEDYWLVAIAAMTAIAMLALIFKD
ncbi:hypothetical protein [Rhodoflexus sp.]